MSNFHSKSLIILTCLFSLVCSVTAQADFSISISTPVPALRQEIVPPRGHLGCYQIPRGFYNDIWAEGYEICQYPNISRGMWVAPHYECTQFAYGRCRQWVWVPAYWDQEWDQRWDPRWIWISLFWDHRWDPHWNRHWEKGWSGEWNHKWRGNWDPNWRAHHGKDWQGERHLSPQWDGRKDPHLDVPTNARFFDHRMRHREQGDGHREGGRRERSHPNER